MPAYSASNSVLVIDPIGLTKEDFSLLEMEKNPLDVLSYFISRDDSPAKFQSNIYEDHTSNFDFDNLDKADNGIMCCISDNKFLFVNLLKNTSWAAGKLNINREEAGDLVADKTINGIKSRNKKYWLVIPDEKFFRLLNSKDKIMETKTEKKKIVRIQDKVHTVIKSGIVGAYGSSIHAECLLPHMKNAYPDIEFTRASVNSALSTLRSHGDLIRVNIIDNDGRPTNKFVPGKYRINIKTDRDLPKATLPEVYHPETPEHPEISYPEHPEVVSDSELVLETNGRSSKNEARIAFENYVKNHIKDGYVSFTIEDISREYPGVNRNAIGMAVSNATRPSTFKNLLRGSGRGHWEYRNSENIPWPSQSVREIEPVKTVASIESKLNIDKIAAELLKKGLSFSEVREILSKN